MVQIKKINLYLYRSKDLGKSWETIFQIPSGVCRHVHGCYWDKFEEKSDFNW